MTELQLNVFRDRYALKGSKGEAIETHPSQMWERVARAIAEVEHTPEKRAYWADRFQWALEDFKLVPGGRILSGAGTNSEVTFFNCYVIPRPADSRSGILESLKNMVEIMARGGGVGLDGSTLRPKGTRVHKVNGKSSGAVSWEEIFSHATGLIEQGGSRRGALMLMLQVWHPDIEEFVTVKEDFGRFNNANLSVLVTDDFMQAVEDDADWELVFPNTADPDYDRDWDGDLAAWRAKGKSVEVYGKVRARDLWNQLCKSAHASGEPGVVFLDRVNKLSNTWYFEPLVATNPCGEQPLPAWGVCNLSAICLPKFVSDDGEVDWETMEEVLKVSTRFCDNVVDATPYFFEENEERQKGARRVGLGTMGLAHMLIKMKLRYGSHEANEFLDKLYKFIRDTVYTASVEIAKEKGPFPKFDAEKFVQGATIQALPNEIREAVAEHGIRNATLITQAPTGTTSLVAGTSSGIEPVFRFKMRRTDRLGEHFIYDPLYGAWEEAHKGEPRPDYFVQSDELTPEEHVRVQAVIQKYTDSSISKTVNAPNEQTVEGTMQVFEYAYKLGCKGITYFRDGARAGVLSEARDDSEQTKEEKSVDAPSNGVAAQSNGAASATASAAPTDWASGAAGRVLVGEVPDEVTGVTYRQKTSVGTARIAINEKDGQPFETIITLGKGGMDITADSEAIGRLISLYLRTPSPMSNVEKLSLIVDQLKNIGGATPYGFGPNKVMSLPDAVAKVLGRYIAAKRGGDGAVASVGGSGWDDELAAAAADLCPSCGSFTFVKEEGCAKCYQCGYSSC